MGDIVNLTDFSKEVKSQETSEDLIQKRKDAISQLKGYRGTVSSRNSIRQLPEVEVGQIFWVELDNKPYIVADKDGKKITIRALDETATISTGITIYEMNKAIVSKEPLFNFEDNEALDNLKEKATDWFINQTSDDYYLLYGRDIHYVSLFYSESGVREKYIDEILKTIQEIGFLISMDFNVENEKSVEIWIRTPESKAELLYLMPYDRGLIKL